MSRRPRFTEAAAGFDPISLFQKWFRQAQRSTEKEPTAMTLATADASGAPSARMVLLKGADQRGLVFFTNYESRKGQELTSNPQAALVFYWSSLNRQIRIRGRVKRVTAAESDEYFASRPRGSQIAACASAQSRPIASRAELEAEAVRLENLYLNRPVPRPTHWGGFRLNPVEIEFWQSGEYRLHDRIRFRKTRAGAWIRERLSP